MGDPLQHPVPPPRLLVIPDDVGDDDGDRPAPLPPAAPRLRLGGLRRLALVAVYLAVGAAVGIAGLHWFPAVRAFRFGATRAESTAPPVPAQRISLADTLALAVTSFELRVRLFEAHKMDCTDLGRGLVVVEEQWTAYNAANRAAGGGLDSAHAAADRALYARVDEAERRFERSPCPRP